MTFSSSLTSLAFLLLGHVIVCVRFVLRTTVAALSQTDPDHGRAAGGCRGVQGRDNFV
jgi:ABC-type Fe3+ transport system permease subunit